MSEPKDSNVYQHLLRGLRESVASALGANVRERDPSDAEILHATVTQACLELDAIISLLGHRENGEETPVYYTLSSLRGRLSLALQLSEGLFNPDRPYVTASAAGYHPDGFDAGIQAGSTAEGSVTP